MTVVTLLMVSIIANAQQKEFSGRIIDQEGNLLKNVVVKISDDSVKTNEKGIYKVHVKSNKQILSFFATNYEEKHIEINAIAGDVVLTKKQRILTPYAVLDKSIYTGVITEIAVGKEKNRPLTNALNAIVGASAGVQTAIASSLPGAGPEIYFRGFTQLGQDNMPIFVVDGIIYTDDIVNINPLDMATISLLKDAVATNLYGKKAKNGVIMITTKKAANKSQYLDVTVNAGIISKGLPDYDKLDAYNYYPIMWEAYRNTLQSNYGIPRNDANNIASGIGNSYNGVTYPSIKEMLGYNPFNVGDNEIVMPNGQINPLARLVSGDNWQDQLFNGQKLRQSYHVNYAKGAEKASLYTSLGYTNEQGYLSYSGIKRYTGRVNGDLKLLKWLTVGANISGTYIQSSVDTANVVANPFYNAMYMGPIYPIYQKDVNGNTQYDTGTARPFATGYNAVQYAENSSFDRNKKVMNGRVYLQLDIFNGLKAITNGALDYWDIVDQYYISSQVEPWSNGRFSERHTFERNYTFNQLLLYNKRLNKHYFNLLAGYEINDINYSYNNIRKYGQMLDEVKKLENYETVASWARIKTETKSRSYLSSFNYSFDERFFVNANFRQDNNKYGFGNDYDKSLKSYALGLGWNLHKEAFFKVKWLDELKLRASYGRISDIDNIVFSLWAGQMNWQYEESAYVNANLGVEMAMCDQKIQLSFDYFKRKAGSENNILTINEGLEVALKYKAFNKQSFKYHISLNLSSYKNRLKLPSSVNGTVSSLYRYVNGGSMYDLYLSEFYGVDKQTGRALYKTNVLNSNSKIIGTDTVTTILSDANTRKIGTVIPDAFGAMQHYFAYKRFSLNFEFTFQLGGKIYDQTYQVLMSPVYGRALHADILERWQETENATSVPRLQANQLM
jgi:TonB-linked SusC/RagA family outer membrane protein